MRPLILLRRVIGKSMSPRLEPGRLVVATGWFRDIFPGEVVIVDHGGKQKVKRVERLEKDKLFVIGDNLEASTDSRHFGWLSTRNVVAKVVWPRL